MSEQRFHSLDAARAFALMCGIVLHATVSFSPAWATTGTPLVDVSPSDTLQGVFHFLHSFRMLLFFVMAGFFGNLLLQRRGMGEFWRNRLRRIAVPFVVGWVVLMPLLAVPIILAVYIKNGGFPGDGRGMAMIRNAGVPLGHLWFLYYLLLLYAVATGATQIIRHRPWSAGLGRVADAGVSWLVRRHAVVVLMPIPVSIALFYTRDWIPWTGIPSPILGLTPQFAAVVAFGCAFGLGWMLYRQPDLLQTWARSWPVHATLALVANAVTMLWLGPVGLADALPTDTNRIIYLLCYTFAGWNGAVAIAGFCVRHLSANSPAWRYLADASYWMYLVHMPLIMLLQVAVMRWPVHWSIKFLLIIVVAFALLLLSYEYMVRYTFIGKWLNGRRHVRAILEGAISNG
jgi:peptidoglycan/LPS O-acetylase OafA/YrhL